MLDFDMPFYAEFSPFWSVIWTFMAGFGGVMLVRGLVEKSWYFLRWNSFKFGESIGLPLYALVVSRELQDYNPDGSWYDEGWFVVLLSILGLAVALLLFWLGTMSRELTKKDFKTPSELFNTFVSYPVLTPMIVHSAVVFYYKEDGVSNSEYALAALGLGLFISLVIYDSIFLNSRKNPGR